MTSASPVPSCGCPVPTRGRLALIRRCLALALCAAILFTPGRAVRADMQFEGLGGFSVEDERELGKEFNLLIRSRLPIIEDPEVTSYIEDMTERITAVMPVLNFEIQPSVIKHSAVNAFAGPAGYLFIHSGLILNFEHESELAGVVAHELAHVSQRHLAEHIEQAQAVSLLAIAGVLAGMIVGSQLGEDGASLGQGLASGSVAAAQSAMLSYSREDERDADNVGMNYLVDAGYPPQGLKTAMETIQRLRWLSTGNEIPTYLTTHPGVDERIGYLEARIESLPEDIRQRPNDDERFLRVQMLIRARYTEPESALGHFQSDQSGSCLSILGQAIVHGRMNHVTQASELFDQAIGCMGEDPLLFREAGRFHFGVGNFQEASYFLDRALARNPNDLMAMFFMARLLGEEGQSNDAAYYFERILRELPEDGEVHYYYGRVLGEGGDLFHAHLHLAYAALYQGDKGQADYHLDKAQRSASGAEAEAELERFQEAYDERAEYW